MLKTFLYIFLMVFPTILFAQSIPFVQWQKCYGSVSGENFKFSDFGDHPLCATSDGGYVFLVYVDTNAGLIEGFHTAISASDIWVVKVSPVGEFEWGKCLGGTNVDNPYSVIECSDGGYAVIGTTASKDGDVSDSGRWNDSDSWVIRLNSTGNIQWEKRIGGNKGDFLCSIIQTSDGGFLTAGYTLSNSEDWKNHGIYNAVVIKLSDTGRVDWQKMYGGTLAEGAYSIIEAFGGGYIFVGGTSSEDGFDVVGGHGPNGDVWVVRLTTNGEIVWSKCLGSDQPEVGNAIIRTTDGGYAICSDAYTYEPGIRGNHGDSDIEVIKLDTSGLVQWQRLLGGKNTENCHTMIETRDSQLVVIGTSNSIDGDVTGLHGEASDTWVVGLSLEGELLWQKTLGGTGIEFGHGIVETSDNGLLVYSTTHSNDGDVYGNYGKSDAWLTKLQFPKNNIEASSTGSMFTNPFPNPSIDEVNIALYRSMTIKEVSYHNILGVKLFPSYKIVSNILTTDVRSLSSGIYTLTIVYQDGFTKQIKRFVK